MQNRTFSCEAETPKIHFWFPIREVKTTYRYWTNRTPKYRTPPLQFRSFTAPQMIQLFVRNSVSVVNYRKSTRQSQSLLARMSK